MLDHLADVSIRAVALAAIAAAVLWMMHGRRTAAMEHAVWTAVVCGMLALFTFGSAFPRLPLRVLEAPAAPVHVALKIAVSTPVTFDENVPAAMVAATPRRSLDWREVAEYAYAATALAFFGRFALGLLLVRRLIAKSVAVDGFRESASIAVPLTVGWLRPQILLPMEWREWDRAKFNGVLAHEGAHAARHDGLVAAMAGVNRCIFWFHPLAWWLERRLGLLAELACDEACVAAMGDRERYARLLVAMAQVVDGSSGRLRGHALTMAAGSHIGKRIESILKEGRTFSRGLNWTGWAAIALCGIPVVWGAGAVALDRQAPLLPLRLTPLDVPRPPVLVAQARPSPPETSPEKAPVALFAQMPQIRAAPIAEPQPKIAPVPVKFQVMSAPVQDAFEMESPSRQIQAWSGWQQTLVEKRDPLSEQRSFTADERFEYRWKPEWTESGYACMVEMRPADDEDKWYQLREVDIMYRASDYVYATADAPVIRRRPQMHFFSTESVTIRNKGMPTSISAGDCGAVIAVAAGRFAPDVPIPVRW